VARLRDFKILSFLVKASIILIFGLGCSQSGDGGFAPGGSSSDPTIDPLSLSISPAVVTLAVNNSFTFTASGGSGGYTYSIAFGSGSILSTTGNYTAPGIGGVATVRVIDSAGAMADAIVTINPALQISPAAHSLSANGSNFFSSTGGVSPYIYSIVSGGGTVNSTSGLYSAPASADTAVIRVTDSLGNTSEATVNTFIGLGISPSTTTLAVNNTTTFSAGGGVPPYVYDIISGGGVIDSSTGVFTAPATAETVVVRVSDALSATADATITINPALQIVPGSQALSANASLAFFANSGGVSPYTFSIVSGSGTINSSTGMYTAPNTAGSAIVRVTDSVGNTSDANVTISAVLVITPSEKTLAVNNATTFVGSGGDAPYVFSVQSGGGSINASTGVYTAPAVAGSAVIIITDALGATATANVTVNAALTINPTSQTTVVSGTLNFSASGGVSPYTYSVLSGGGSINAATGIYTAPGAAGSAVIRVTDSFGNISDSNVTINNVLAISPVSVTVAVNNIFTFLGAGGEAPYVFSIQSGTGSINSSTGQYTAPATPGSAIIRITDALGATATANVTVNSALNISPTSQTIGVNGSQTFIGLNGVSPYTYSIASGGGSINSASGAFTAPATAGSVTIQVADSLGNTANSIVTVVSSIALTPTTKTLAVNNTFTFSGSGGEAPYIFSIQSGGGSINSSTGVFTAPAVAGSAVVRITDAIGQTATANVTVNSALAISPATQTMTVNGSLNFSSSGGVSPYTYSIFSGTGSVVSGTGVYTAPAVAGSAVVRVTDSLGNTSDSNVTINNLLGISPASQTLAVNNTFTFSASGGQAPYTFSLQSGTGSIHSTSGLYTAPAASGSAVILVTDNLGSTTTANVIINSALSILPSSLTIAVNGSHTFAGSNGVSPYTYSIVSGGGSINSTSGAFVAPATAGGVVVRVTDSLSNTVDSSVTVVSTLVMTPVSKTLAVNNSFTFVGSGGQSPYTYSVQSGSGSVVAATGVYTAGALAGSAVVRVTDAIGQTATSNVTVNAALAISPATHVLAVSGTINYATSGGVSPYSYSILSGAGTIVSGTGVYTAPNTSGSDVVQVTDSLGNTSQSAVTINDALGITPVAVTVAVNNTYTFSTTGGTAPFTFSIQSGAGSIHPTSGVYTAPATAGSAVVEVTDNLGATATANVTVNAALVISPAITTVAVNNSQTLTATGGVSPFVYSIVSGGGSVNSGTGVFDAAATPGGVTVRVTDSLNNTSDSTITVVSALDIVPTAKALAVNNVFAFSGSGGQTPYIFSMQSGLGSINSSSGVYTAAASSGTAVVRVTDAIGQTATASVTINDALVITPSTSTILTNGTQTFSATGGITAYTYSLVSGPGSIHATTGVYTPTVTGTAVVRVTDSIGNTSDANLTIDPVNVAPTISAISNQTTNEDIATGAISFTITDADSTLDCSTSVTATSSNISLIPVVNIVFAGTAPNCTVTLAPEANTNGTSNIILTVSDGFLTATSPFVLTVSDVNDAPVVSSISNQSIKTDAAQVVNYSLIDDNALSCSTDITVSSGTTSVIPNSDIVKGGVAPNCTLTISPSLNVVGSSLITVTGSDGFLSSSQTFTVTTANVVSVAVAPTPFSMVNAGSTQQLTATATYSDATTENVTTNSNASWTSNATAVANVNNTSSKGLVTAGSTGGNVNITVTHKGATAVASATVYLVSGLTVSQSMITGGIDANYSVSAQAVLSPSGSSDVTAAASWSSSNSAVASVSAGVITLNSSGTATITASYAGYSQTVNVTVQNKTLTSISVTPGTYSMGVSATRDFVATATFSDASTQDVTSSVVWTTSNSGVATVSNTIPTKGRATGIATGSATITATINSIFGSAALTINAATLSSIAITPYDALVASNESQQLTAIGTFSDASTANITDQVTWSSSNTLAATISNTAGSRGFVTTPSFTGYRSTTITATLNAISGTTPLGVNGATVTSIVVTPAVTITAGSTYDLKAWANLSDGGTIDVTNAAIWTSATTSRVTVSNGVGSKGVVTGVSIGSSVVSAVYGGVTGTRTVTVGASQVITEVGTGLNGNYYTWTGSPPPTNGFLEANKKGTRIDSRISFAWAAGNSPMGVGDQFSVRWTGFYVPTSGSTYFCAYSDDGIRVWLNGVQIINNWTEHGPTWNCSSAQTLTIGTKYSITVEYYENGGGSEAHLTHSPTSAAAARNLSNTIPQSSLYPQ